MTRTQLSSLLEFAVETANSAGKLTLETFQKQQLTEIKEDGSIVTATDKKVEQFVRDQIRTYYPDHNILGEEYGQNNQSEGHYRWIVDPIDGTESYVNGVPLYAVLVALEIDGESRIGVAHFPALNYTLYAAAGMGCFFNGNRVLVDDSITAIQDAIVTITDLKTLVKSPLPSSLDNLISQAKIARGWGDAYGYFLVACGRTALHFDAVMKVWDCAPFLPIMTEAGGYFGDWNGNRTIYCESSMATTKKLLPQVLEFLKEDKRISNKN
ncbi:MAG: inositol monophosphatase family protein [Bacteroidota bacterium]